MKTLLTLVFTLNFLVLTAQVNVRDVDPGQVFGQGNEIYFALPGSGPDAATLTRLISIDNVKGDTIFAYANRKEFANLQQNGGRNFLLLKHPGTLIDPTMSSNPREVLEWNYYPTYPAYEQLMQDFATNYPDICSLHTIGVLPSGRKLLAMRISDNVNVEEDEPEFFYTSTMHGDETTGYVLMLHLIDYLLTNYNTDPRITNMVNNVDIWINPLANPDGTYAGGNNSVNGAQRYNANYVDLNRNYPDPEDGPHPDGEAWQPETVAFMELAENRSFVMSANFHGGAEVVNYPWDTWSRLAADNNWWVLVSREYADTCHAHSPSGYLTDLDNGITNGYAWYTTAGCRQDYMNYFQQCRESTIEISATKLVPAIQLINFWNYNYRSLLNYIEQTTYGVRGIVSDTISGEPIKAQVFISGHDMDSSMVFTSLPVGNYHRMLKAGTYNLTFFAEGYMPKTLHNVVITDKGTVRRDVKLWNGTAIPAFTSSDTLTHAGGNIQFNDISGGNPTSRLWTFEGGNNITSTEPNPVITYNQPGEYNVSLYVTNSIGSNQLIRQDYITVTPDYYIGNLNPTTCYAGFHDSNGPDGEYGPAENLVSTFTSADPEKVLRIKFTSLDIENTSGCTSDVLSIYDGPDTNSPLILNLCGSDIPEDILTNIAGGSVTFSFESDAINNLAGWSAVISCDTGVGIAEKRAPGVSIYPNPVRNKSFIIESEETMDWVELSDFAGRLVYRETINAQRKQIRVNSFTPGIYMVKARTAKGYITGKLLIMGE
ncbi:MAG: T9SS type A sorting domain-containing protein [Bacteroidales bacterium]|nr:T9SS type A sorting domain-containing protein [Bacteroidales bacterium]